MNVQSRSQSDLVAIVIEWENALNAEASRPFEALDVLNGQLNDLPQDQGPLEVILSVNPSLVEPNDLRQAAGHHLVPMNQRYAWRV